MVTRAVWTSLVFGVFGAGILFGCSGKVAGKSGGETNWLAKCATDGQCTGDATCICGVCSKTCTSNAVCPANGTCVRSGTRAFSATCGSATVTGLCVEKCPTNGCEGPQACTENACVPAPLRNGDASTGGTASQGGNGGASNVGGNGGRDAGSQRDAGNDGGHPNYGSWTVECPVGGDPGGVGLPPFSTCAFVEGGALGTCVPRDTALSNPFGPMLGHDTCKAPLYCAPSPQFFDGGVGTWTQCRTTVGLLVSLEGRCVPRGFAPVPASQYRLTNENCPTSFACVPCFGPIDGTPTGACNGPGDYPREGVPSSPKTCGAFDGGPWGGLCAPRADAESWDLYLSFAQDDCAKGDVCAPTSLVRQGWGHCFQRCTTSLDALGPEYAPGACLPAYLIRDLGRVAPATLMRGTCALGELCSPCANPQMPGISTGACD